MAEKFEEMGYTLIYAGNIPGFYTVLDTGRPGPEIWNGINAMYAAMQGLSAANAIRETFAEQDIIRFHPIVTHGGEAVNAIPELVTIESYVRGAGFEAIKNANKKINQALCGGALSLGANVEIIDTPGYAPLKNDENMIQLTPKMLQI